MNALTRIYHKHRKIIRYAGCSVATAALETGVDWCLIHLTGMGIVPANTISILIGAVAHYFLTLALVFELDNNVQSALAYLLTFALGLLLQNLIISLFYDHLLVGLGDLPRLLISKGLSLVIPFFLTYYLRSVINQAIRARREKKDENSGGNAPML